MEKKRVIIAFGGASPEHEVSVLTAHQAIAALDGVDEFELIPLYVTKAGRWLTGDSLLELKNFEHLSTLEKECYGCSFAQNRYGASVLRVEKKNFFSSSEEIRPDVILIAFHGSSGENGAFQGICEFHNFPYTGSGVAASAAGMDKVLAKQLCRAAGIPVVEWVDFHEEEWVARQNEILDNMEALEYPLVVKPVHLGSSIGVKMVTGRESLVFAVEQAFRYDSHLLAEKAIQPLTEINCSVMGSAQEPEVSVCERPLGREELLSFQDKYLAEDGTKGMASASRIIPADIPETLSSEIRENSRAIFHLLGCRGIARLDFLLEKETGNYYFNEINTIPGSFSFYLWQESGLSFTELLKKLIQKALEEQRKKNRRIQSYETNLLSRKAVKGIKGLKGTKK